MLRLNPEGRSMKGLNMYVFTELPVINVWISIKISPVSDMKDETIDWWSSVSGLSFESIMPGTADIWTEQICTYALNMTSPGERYIIYPPEHLV